MTAVDRETKFDPGEAFHTEVSSRFHKAPRSAQIPYLSAEQTFRMVHNAFREPVTNIPPADSALLPVWADGSRWLSRGMALLHLIFSDRYPARCAHSPRHRQFLILLY